MPKPKKELERLIDLIEGDAQEYVWQISDEASRLSDMVAHINKLIPECISDDGKLLPASSRKPLREKIAEIRNQCVELDYLIVRQFTCLDLLETFEEKEPD